MPDFGSREVEWLTARLLRHYDSQTAPSLPAMEFREFGYGVFGSKISARHLAFSSPDEFRRFLLSRAPFYVSASVARYRFPGRQPMAAKRLTGADLVFEFDADEIPTECKNRHDSWECPQCRANGKGRVRKCAQCGSGTLVEEWFCPECIGATKTHALRLIRLLADETGLSDYSVHFSGNAGYHVYVRSPEVQSWPASARTEIFDFATGANIDFARLGFDFEGARPHGPPLSEARAWARRAIAHAIELLPALSVDELAAHTGVTSSAAKRFLSDTASVELGLKTGTWFPAPGKKPGAFYRALFTLALSRAPLLPDRQTTLDIHKIVRVPDTIHGSTMLVARTIPIDGFESFDPFSSALALSVEAQTKVFIPHAPQFFLAGQWWGPFENATERLPDAVAGYLLARKAATLGDDAP